MRRHDIVNLAMSARRTKASHVTMNVMKDDFPVVPPILIKDAPKPRRLSTLRDARDYVAEAMRLGRPAPWREVWHRLRMVASDEDAIEAIGDLRELLAEEDLLLPSRDE
jgi:hypothetical protein